LACRLCIRTEFIQRDKPRKIESVLLGTSFLATWLHIGAFLFAGPQSFFIPIAQTLEFVVHRDKAAATAEK